ncbi:hypothetical protein FQN55_006628 [Onygenales sp. PD_40]|nr:hypothetical protein FQN55_006628 [Onygenales sp. PD_40]KAK2777065.1 hypothetical protein FQN52_003249 [Onygenales sp. PD_12]KAK2795563.1 hypothetical protein FQN51_000417 [Onygenales sp. PD_10]
MRFPAVFGIISALNIPAIASPVPIVEPQTEIVGREAAPDVASDASTASPASELAVKWTPHPEFRCSTYDHYFNSRASCNK